MANLLVGIKNMCGSRTLSKLCKKAVADAKINEEFGNVIKTTTKGGVLFKKTSGGVDTYTCCDDLGRIKTRLIKKNVDTFERTSELTNFVDNTKTITKINDMQGYRSTRKYDAKGKELYRVTSLKDGTLLYTVGDDTLKITRKDGKVIGISVPEKIGKNPNATGEVKDLNTAAKKLLNDKLVKSQEQKEIKGLHLSRQDWIYNSLIPSNGKINVKNLLDASRKMPPDGVDAVFTEGVKYGDIVPKTIMLCK